MTEEELLAIASRAEAATAGPWGVGKTANGTTFVRAPNGYVPGVFLKAPDRADLMAVWERDARFAAAARSDVPALVAEVRKLRGVLRECEWVQQDTHYGTRGLCPCCGQLQPGSLGWGDEPLDDTGHLPYCRLAAALGVTTPRSPG